MQEDFNKWNEIKKEINTHIFKPLFSEKEIWWCSVGVNVGSEENGKNELFERPVLVFKKINNDTFLGIPLSSQVKNFPFLFKYKFNNEDRVLKINQVKTFSVNRLLRRMGKMSDPEFLDLQKTVINFLLHKDETPSLVGVSRAPFGDSDNSVANPPTLSSHFYGKIALKFILNDEDDNILICKSKLETLYELPGGRIDLEETIESASKRELYEELGIDLEKFNYIILNNFQALNPNENIQHFYFILKINLPTKFKILIKNSEEVSEFIWVNFSNFKNYNYKKFLKKNIYEYFKQTNFNI